MPGEKKGNQTDKTQSHEIPKPRTYDFFPTARAAFIGKKEKSELRLMEPENARCSSSIIH